MQNQGTVGQQLDDPDFTMLQGSIPQQRQNDVTNTPTVVNRNQNNRNFS